MIKHLLRKLLSSLLHSKQGHYPRKPMYKKYSSSDVHKSNGYRQGHRHYKNKYGRYSSS
ncbi:hypothetical protein [Paenibacillus silviterrae]|uniref:hypothetical protein n=1 Tax=Paenibacillus silviterrae TaxID=3242194 RepID=UPI0025431DCC|nr:hypothetical protein [Paenibacillus chinjuensis]